LDLSDLLYQIPDLSDLWVGVALKQEKLTNLIRRDLRFVKDLFIKLRYVWWFVIKIQKVFNRNAFRILKFCLC